MNDLNLSLIFINHSFEIKKDQIINLNKFVFTNFIECM